MCTPPEQGEWGECGSELLGRTKFYFSFAGRNVVAIYRSWKHPTGNLSPFVSSTRVYIGFKADIAWFTQSGYCEKGKQLAACARGEDREKYLFPEEFFSLSLFYCLPSYIYEYSLFPAEEAYYHLRLLGLRGCRLLLSYWLTGLVKVLTLSPCC